MEYAVYVIQSIKDGRFYTGITNDLSRRLREHNQGAASTSSTKHRGPFKLVYKESGFNRAEARRRERYLKSGAGREFRNKILNPKSPG